MAFEEIKENVEEIQEQTQAYIEKIAYYKLRLLNGNEINDYDFKVFLILLGFSMVLLFL
jgi:restriction endonuclease S subunit